MSSAQEKHHKKNIKASPTEPSPSPLLSISDDNFLRKAKKRHIDDDDDAYPEEELCQSEIAKTEPSPSPLLSISDDNFLRKAKKRHIDDDAYPEEELCQSEIAKTEPSPSPLLSISDDNFLRKAKKRHIDDDDAYPEEELCQSEIAKTEPSPSPLLSISDDNFLRKAKKRHIDDDDAYPEEELCQSEIAKTEPSPSPLLSISDDNFLRKAKKRHIDDDDAYPEEELCQSEIAKTEPSPSPLLSISDDNFLRKAKKRHIDDDDAYPEEELCQSEIAKTEPSPSPLLSISDDNFLRKAKTRHIDDDAYSEEELCQSEIAKPKDIRKTPFVYIKTKNELLKMIQDIKSKGTFAFDVEFWRYCSYEGKTSLIQISTDNDYIVDPRALKADDVKELSGVFEDKAIFKVAHGTSCDVIWLQKDFGIKIRNLMDTYEMAKQLKIPEKSYGALLKQFLNIDTDKSLQKANWSWRPLPQNMIDYARIDSHYLFYIYQCLKSKLTEEDYQMCAKASENIAMTVYERKLFNPERYTALCKGMDFDEEKKMIVKDLYILRENIARTNDKFVCSILTNEQLLSIAQKIPSDNEELLKLFPKNPPFLVQNYGGKILNILSQATASRNNPHS